jgi:hypothetical protein
MVELSVAVVRLEDVRALPDLHGVDIGVHACHVKVFDLFVQ